MSSIDWSIVAGYAVIAILIGLYFTRRASASSENFFLAGRSLPWFIAGTSMVATTFSSDTPLWVAGAVRSDGIAAVWIMWANMLGTLATVFYFARLWRRSEVLTEVEFVIRRYSGTSPTHFLRVFKALFDGGFVNCIIIASVTLAMSKVLSIVLGLSDDPLFVLPIVGSVTPVVLILLLLGLAAVLYTVLAGLFGVVYTDLVQFALAMIGAFALAIIVYVDLAPQGGLIERLSQTPGFDFAALNMFPSLGWNIETATFVILITVGWLFLAPGTGFYLQRVLATRSEKDAMLSVYWYCFCNYILRSWPWIVVGIASVIYFPGLLDSEDAYPSMLNELLPVGLKGVMVASLLAAFMSTLDTHLNWGSSYFVNDIYKPYIRPEREKTHYVAVGRLAMGVLVLIAIGVATRLTGLLDAYKYLSVFWAGVSFVLIARWYWWRINAWSEIATLLCASIFGNALFWLLPDSNGQDWFAIRMAANFAVTTLVCLLVTYATSQAQPDRKVLEFYQRIRAPGPGWERVRVAAGADRPPPVLVENTRAFVASVFFMFGLLLLFGYALVHAWLPVVGCVLICALSGAYLARNSGSLLE